RLRDRLVRHFRHARQPSIKLSNIDCQNLSSLDDAIMQMNICFEIDEAAEEFPSILLVLVEELFCGALAEQHGRAEYRVIQGNSLFAPLLELASSVSIRGGSRGFLGALFPPRIAWRTATASSAYAITLSIRFEVEFDSHRRFAVAN